MNSDLTTIDNVMFLRNATVHRLTAANVTFQYDELHLWLQNYCDTLLCNAPQGTCRVQALNDTQPPCLCAQQWTGVDCDICPSPYRITVNPTTNNYDCLECGYGHNGPDCSELCTCENGICTEAGKVSACLRCNPGYFNANCSGVCTCRNGVCYDGIDGTGRCLFCYPGWSGVNCEVPCLCEHGICNTGIDGNGRCLQCQSGWYGPYCNQSCTCQQGTCASTVDGDGSCATCNAGWYGRNCDQECQCPDGCNDGIRGDGSCRNVCPSPNFSGTDCKECKSGFYGFECQACHCAHGDCNDGIHGNGFCRSCDSGYYGATCTSSCTCDHGVCSEGPTGDGRCLQCTSTYWGQNCENNCTCQGGICNSGISGDGSCAQCATSTFAGPDCALNCTCLFGVCNAGPSGDGTCLECFDGYRGANCDQCLLGHFGRNCTRCLCNNGVCDDGISGNGHCRSCNVGWQGLDCDQCAPGYYGPSCARCPDCGPFGECSQGLNGTGQCRCDVGVAGVYCQDCDETHYGPTCAPCPDCFPGTCDSGIGGSGVCNCPVNYTGITCKDCPLGRFGANCDGICPDCGDHGICIDGRYGTGQCVCLGNWQTPPANVNDLDPGVCSNCNQLFYGSVCPNQCPTCAPFGYCNNGTAGNGQCTCFFHFDTATNCTQCLPGWNRTDLCRTCTQNYNLDTECTTCINQYDISTNCTQCLNHFALGSQCRICEPGWAGAACDHCAPTFTGPNCDQCVNHYMEPNCLVCDPNWDLAQECAQCINNYDITTSCQSCKPGYNISTQCSLCRQGLDPSTNCASCKPYYTATTGADGSLHCDSCIYGGLLPEYDCQPVVCRQGWANGPQTLCEVCAPGWGPPNQCTQCRDGFDPATNCTSCLPNRYGDHCGACPCVNGFCNTAGGSGGLCTCTPHFTGELCDQCLPQYLQTPFCDTCQPNYRKDAHGNCTLCAYDYYGAQCQACNCIHGVCNDGLSGDGFCLCYTGWSGSSCNQCAPGFASNGTDCICPPGFANPQNGCSDCAPGYFGATCQPVTCVTANGVCYDTNPLNTQQCYGKTGTGHCNWCFPHFDGLDCNTCLNHYQTYPACDICQMGYRPYTQTPIVYPYDCSYCLTYGLDPNAQCTACKTGYTGPNCDACAAGWTASRGVAIHYPFTDPDGFNLICTQCPNPGMDPKTNCTTCLPNFIPPPSSIYEYCACFDNLGQTYPCCNDADCQLGTSTCADCLQAFPQGICVGLYNPDAPACNDCVAGYFGSACSQPCTCVHGICNSGPAGNGQCGTCDPGWAGPNCDQCPTGMSGSDCGCNIYGFYEGMAWPNAAANDPTTKVFTQCTTCLSGWSGTGCETCNSELDPQNGYPNFGQAYAAGALCVYCQQGWLAINGQCVPCDTGYWNDNGNCVPCTCLGAQLTQLNIGGTPHHTYCDPITGGCFCPNSGNSLALNDVTTLGHAITAIPFEISTMCNVAASTSMNVATNLVETGALVCCLYSVYDTRPAPRPFFAVPSDCAQQEADVGFCMFGMSWHEVATQIALYPTTSPLLQARVAEYIVGKYANSASRSLECHCTCEGTIPTAAYCLNYFLHDMLTDIPQSTGTFKSMLSGLFTQWANASPLCSDCWIPEPSCNTCVAQY